MILLMTAVNLTIDINSIDVVNIDKLTSSFSIRSFLTSLISTYALLRVISAFKAIAS